MFLSVVFNHCIFRLVATFTCILLHFHQGFDQLRIEGLLCDVTLVAGDGDEAFPVHRAMMASSSDYFKAMFTGESAQPTQNICTTLHEPSHPRLCACVVNIYSVVMRRVD